MKERKTIYDIRRTACRALNAFQVIVVLIISALMMAELSQAQIAPRPSLGALRFVVNGSASPEPPRPAEVADPDASIGSFLDDLRSRGFHRARVDSVRKEALFETVYVSEGPVARIHALRIEGVEAGVADDLLADMFLAPDSALDMQRLHNDARSILNYFSERGFHMASVSIAGIEPVATDSLMYDVILDIVSGPLVPIEQLELPGAERTRVQFAARTAGLRLGEVLYASELESFADRLREMDAFTGVGSPALELTRDSTAIMIIPIEEAPPGTFDLVLGYLPPSGPSSKAQVVGSGHLNLLNPFGSGRAFGLKLDRRPGQVSGVEVKLRDPQIIGLPIQGGISFSGLQQDSTYNRRQWAVDVGYRLLRGVEIGARYAVEVTRPGGAGLRLRGGRQRIPRSDVGFLGLVLRVRRLDRLLNPRSGIYLESVIENGDERERFKRITLDGDTTHVARTVRQERLKIATRGYIPAFSNQSIVVGFDAQVLLSDQVDESDLFRFGGATTLRGYDEDQFRASTALRFLLEYRILIDAVSHAFTFFDLGYIEAPDIAEIPAQKQWYPGFGLGMQMETAVGVLSVSYALNDRDGFANGRVHLGVSFGL